MKLWATLCRATQDGWVVMESDFCYLITTVCSCIHLFSQDHQVLRAVQGQTLYSGLHPKIDWVKNDLSSVKKAMTNSLYLSYLFALSCYIGFEVHQFCSVQFSHSVISNFLWPHESQHARPPSSSPTPRVYSNSCPSSRWYHSAISSAVIPFSSCPQSLPESGSFPMSQLVPSGGQSIGVSASASILPMNTQDWSLLGWTGWISWQSKGLSRVFSITTVQKYPFLGAQLSPQSNSHIHTWPLEKP